MRLPDKWFYVERHSRLFYFQTVNHNPTHSRGWLLEYDVMDGEVTNPDSPRDMVLNLDECYHPRGGVE